MSINFARLAKKYGASGWQGQAYRWLVSQIINENSQQTERLVGRIDTDRMQNYLKKLPKSKSKKIVVPDFREALTKKSIAIRKAAQSGDIITNTLRDQLRGAMMQALQERPSIMQGGVGAGRVNVNTIKSFEKKIQEVFENYKGKSKSLKKVPGNLHAIAVTEVRSTIDNVRYEYVKQFNQQNPEAKLVKVWRHNSRLSKVSREHHMAMDGVKVPFNESFVLPNGVRMKHPHDPSAPPEEVINCNCEAEYLLTI